MPSIVVSAARFRSMLANRHMTVEVAEERITTSVNLRTLASEDQPVEFKDLETLGKLFKRPWSCLLSDEEELLPQPNQDNRTHANQKAPASAALLEEYEAAADLLEAASDLFPELGYQVPDARITLETPADRAAQEIRSFLSVSVDAQLEARDGYAALRLWVESLHRRGVYVLQRKLRDETIRAFSRAEGDQAVVVVDTTDTAYARSFSVLHEYCHVILRSTGICDLDDHRSVERYCNEVTAAVLLPDALLDDERVGVREAIAAGLDDEQLIGLSRHLRVSQAALLIRLRDRGSISQGLYDQLEASRQARRHQGGTKGGGSYYSTAINRVGRRFARNVFGAVDDGALTRQDAGALLGVGEHSVDRFRSELFAGEAGAP
ncbi:ImmA/IrrE family metallo-endopeptidase [Janibacter sp. RAF52]|uniref:ImmA/IrrE family metallo-endopeptidase n=1 Tax=unclassified Janibacter TaxID=2649294 RepID=UPI003F92071D